MHIHSQTSGQTSERAPEETSERISGQTSTGKTDTVSSASPTRSKNMTGGLWALVALLLVQMGVTAFTLEEAIVPLITGIPISLAAIFLLDNAHRRADDAENLASEQQQVIATYADALEHHRKALEGAYAEIEATYHQAAQALQLAENERRNQVQAARELEQAQSALQMLHDALDRADGELNQISDTRSAFLANVSQEIRIPMNGVLGMTDQLLQSSLTAEQIDFASTIRSSGESLLTTLNDLLGHHQGETAVFPIEEVQFGLRRQIEDVIQLYGGRAHSKGLELNLSYDTDLQDAFTGDPTRLRQVVSNLVSNAVKFTPSGEVIVTVATGRQSQQEDTKWIRVEVSDTGIGIPESVAPRLFAIIEHKDKIGTEMAGLGLTFSRKLVQNMGGEIGVRAKKGEGSTFWFEVPLHHATAVKPSQFGMFPPQKLEGRARRALIVDDNVTSRNLLITLLQNLNIKVQAAADGAEALGLLLGIRRAGKTVDLVVLNQNMPRMTGLDVARAIRQDPDYGAPAVILLSSTSAPVDKEKATLYGVHTVHTKPIREEGLREAVISAVLGTEPRKHRLPVLPQPMIDLASAENDPAEALFGMRVLVAEDNPVNARLTVTQLHRMGASTETAHNGLVAVEIVEETGQHFDAILMDCQMPIMDGPAATRHIRAIEGQKGKTPIIALTTRGFNNRQMCTEAGMDGYLTKPYTIEDLHAVLRPWQEDPAKQQDATEDKKATSS